MSKRLILVELKEAFYEGWNSYSTPASAYNSAEEAWEESEAKKFYDSEMLKLSKEQEQ